MSNHLIAGAAGLSVAMLLGTAASASVTYAGPFVGSTVTYTDVIEGSANPIEDPEPLYGAPTGITGDVLPVFARVIRERWFLVLPLAVLVVLLFGGYTPLFAGTVGLTLTVIMILGTAFALGIGHTALRVAFWIGLAGWFFLPFTTLAYSAMNAWGDPINGFGWVIVAFAFIADLGSWFGTGSQRNRYA